MNTLNAKQVKQLRDEDEDFLLINTLDEEQFPKTKIPGSINIPQSHADFVDRVEREAGDKDKTIVVYCASVDCSSSPQAALKLEGAGFTNVYDFEAGAKGWAEAGEQLAAA
jgi:rhodanese-related sulfurtransferase